MILGSLYFILNLQASQLPEYHDTLTRIGLIQNNFPSGIKLIVAPAIAILLAFIFFARKKYIPINKISLFMVAGLLASIIVTNQNVITGIHLEFYAHYLMAASLWFIFAIGFLIRNIVKESFSVRLIAALVIAFFIIVNVPNIFSNVRAYFPRSFDMPARQVYRQNYVPIFDWLNENTQKDDVVYAGAKLSHIIPAYTHNNVFYITRASIYFMSDEEVLERFLLNNFFEDIDEQFVIRNFPAVYGSRYRNIYHQTEQNNKIRRILGLKQKVSEKTPQFAIDRVMVKAREVKDKNLRQQLQKYRIDYVVWDKNKNPNWQLDKYNFPDPLYIYNNIYIYKY